MGGSRIIPASCESVEQFNAALLGWLARSSPGDTLGPDHGQVVTTVAIGNEHCELHGGTSRQGVADYLALALLRTNAFSVVASTQGVFHRVSLGDALERIPGFYLYTSAPRSRPGMIASADGSAFSVIDFHLKLHQAVVYLHAAGHQRLRVISGMADMGWRFNVLLSDDPDGRGQDLAWWQKGPPALVYRWDGDFRVGDLWVGPSTPISDVAHAMVDSVRDKGIGIDWAYAGWYAEFVAAARGLHTLPVGFASTSHDYELSWTVGADIPFPPPPPSRAGGFDDVFPRAHETPFRGLDVLKMPGFRRLLATFDHEPGGQFLGLVAIVGNDVYSRSDGVWRSEQIGLARVATRRTVDVSYRFIKSLDLLNAHGGSPTWTLAQQMRTFSSGRALNFQSGSE